MPFPEDYDYEEEKYYCKSCVLPTKVRKEDMGMGPHSTGFHSSIVYSTECCGDHNYESGYPEAIKVYERFKDLLKAEKPIFQEYLEALWTAVE